MRELRSTHNATRIQSYYSFKLSNRIIQSPTGRDGCWVDSGPILTRRLGTRDWEVESWNPSTGSNLLSLSTGLTENSEKKKKGEEEERERGGGEGDRKERVGREMLGFVDQRDLNFQWENSPTLQQSIQNTPTPPHPHPHTPHPTTPMPQKERK